MSPHEDDSGVAEVESTVRTTSPIDTGHALRPPSAEVDQLRRQGHLVVPIEPTFTFGAGELLKAMIDSGAMAQLLAERSPRINSQWLGTASALCQRPSTLRSVWVGLCRFPHALLLPMLSQLIVWLFLDYYVHSGVTLSFPSLYTTLRRQTTTTGESWRGTVVAGSILGCWFFSLALQLYLSLSMLRLVRYISVRRRSPLAELPDCAQLLLVLRKLRILTSAVPVWNVVDPDCADVEGQRLHRVLRLLQSHDAVHILAPDEARAAATAARYDLITIVDLDRCEAQALPPPPGLRPSCMNFCVAWSVTHDYKALDAASTAAPSSALAQWTRHVTHTIVAKPRCSEDMLESVLCRILQLALTSGDDLARLGAPFMQKRVTHLQRCTRLYPGGEFEVPASHLAASDAALHEGSLRFMR